MFESILSASNIYVDIAIIALLGIMFLFGLARGFSRSLKGLGLTLTVLLISVLIAGAAYEPLRATPIAGQLEDTINQSAQGWGASFNNTVVNTGDGFVAIYEDGTRVDLKDVEGGVKGTLAVVVATMFVKEGVTDFTLGQATAYGLTSIVFLVGLILICCIALSIIFAILRHATEGIRYSHGKGVRWIDRILGALVSAALGFILVLFIFAILEAVGAQIPEAIDYIKNSAVGGFIFDNNPIGEAFAKIKL